MRKHISFSVATTIAGLAMVFWATFGVVYTKAESWVIVIHCTAAPADPGIGPDLRLIGGADKLARDRA